MWTFVALIGVLFALWVIYRKKVFQQLKDLGIPGPEPNLIFGNLLEIAFKNPIECHKEWIKKYGKIIGYYFGTTPVVLIADVDYLKTIQVSEFHNFMNRPNVFRSRNFNERNRVEGFSQQLIVLRDKKWKEIRSIMTPSFTTSKMKQMAPLMNGAIDSLLKNVAEKSNNGESFDIYELYQGLTMDTIGRTAFGIHTDVQNNPDDPFLRSAKALFSLDIRNPFLIIGAAFRSLAFIWSWLGRLRLTLLNQGTNPIKELILSTKKVIAMRRTNKDSRRPDLLQLMLDAEIEDIDSVTAEDLTANDKDGNQENTKRDTSSGKITRKMTDADVLDNSVLFFLAAYETTSTALAFTTHLLIHHPEIQQNVRNEVLDLLRSEGKLDYNSINKLPYLEQVFLESLRLFPPVYLFVNRECAQDVDYGKLRLKKGLALQVAVYNIHRDPELWDEPEVFKPERFAPENKSKLNPLAFQPFGAGPRNCVGMRFALMEAKLTLARLLAGYKLELCSKTEKEDLELKIAQSSINPKNGVWTKVVSVQS